MSERLASDVRFEAGVVVVVVFVVDVIGVGLITQWWRPCSGLSLVGWLRSYVLALTVVAHLLVVGVGAGAGASLWVTVEE